MLCTSASMSKPFLKFMIWHEATKQLTNPGNAGFVILVVSLRFLAPQKPLLMPWRLNGRP